MRAEMETGGKAEVLGESRLKISAVSAALLIAVFSIGASAQQPSNILVLNGESRAIVIVSDLVAVTFCALGLALGVRFVNEFGGTIGEGLRFMLAGIAAVGLNQLLDLLAHSGILNIFDAIGFKERLFDDVVTAIAMSLFLYGMWKLRTK